MLYGNIQRVIQMGRSACWSSLRHTIVDILQYQHALQDAHLLRWFGFPNSTWVPPGKWSGWPCGFNLMFSRQCHIPRSVDCSFQIFQALMGTSQSTSLVLLYKSKQSPYAMIYLGIGLSRSILPALQERPKWWLEQTVVPYMGLYPEEGVYTRPRKHNMTRKGCLDRTKRFLARLGYYFGQNW